jgi:hypothetical protein
MHHIGDLSNVLNGGACGLVLSAVSRKGTKESSFLRDGLLERKQQASPSGRISFFGSDEEGPEVFGGLHKAT